MHNPIDNRSILLSGDPHAKLDTGMTAGEAIRRTRFWWDQYGRKMMIEKAEDQVSAMRSQFATLDPDDDNFLPSGILAGLEWDILSKREKLRLVKVWHHFNIRNKDIIGSPEHEYKFGQGATVK